VLLLLLLLLFTGSSVIGDSTAQRIDRQPNPTQPANRGANKRIDLSSGCIRLIQQEPRQQRREEAVMLQKAGDRESERAVFQEMAMARRKWRSAKRASGAMAAQKYQAATAQRRSGAAAARSGAYGARKWRGSGA
jgi:hypothetical protein